MASTQEVSRKEATNYRKSGFASRCDSGSAAVGWERAKEKEMKNVEKLRPRGNR